MRNSLLAIGLSTALVLGSASLHPAAAADRPDGWLTMKTQIALLTTEGVDTSDLDVNTENGIVTLHGKVASETAKAKAEEVAKSIDGVKRVKNLLQIVPEAARETVAERDDELRDRVEKALAQHDALAESDIVVASVNNGVVLLSGATDDLQLHLQAIQTADKVDGVKRVASEVYVDPNRSE